MRTGPLVALGLAACGARAGGVGDGAGPGTDAPPGADAPAGFADAAPLGAWGTPTPLAPAALPTNPEDDGSATSDETELMFASRVGTGPKDLFVLTRPTPLDPWGPRALVTELQSASGDATPRFTTDGLTVYFSSNRAGGVGGDDIWTSNRGDRASPWGIPTLVPVVNSAQDDRTLTPCTGNHYVMISFRAGDADVYDGTLGQAPTRIASLSTTGNNEISSFVSADCLSIWFASNRDGSLDIFRGHRLTVGDPWVLDGKVDELSTDAAEESDPWVSHDGRRMVFASDADGELDLYESSR